MAIQEASKHDLAPSELAKLNSAIMMLPSAGIPLLDGMTANGTGWTLMACMVPLAANAAEPAPNPVEVMVVGVFHMNNPGHDLHDPKADDVLEPKRQREIAAVTAVADRYKLVEANDYLPE
jgi:hypothetical protein